MSSNLSLTSSVIPSKALKCIISNSHSVGSVNPDAMFLIAKSTEFFISTLTRQSYDDAEDVEDELSYDHLSEFVQSNEVLQFLHDILPRKIPYSEALKLMETTEVDFSGSEDDTPPAKAPVASKKKKSQKKDTGQKSAAGTSSGSKKKSSPKKQKRKPVEKVIEDVKQEAEIDVHFEDEESNQAPSSLGEFEVESASVFAGPETHVKEEDDDDSVVENMSGDENPSKCAVSRKSKGSVDHDYFT